MPTRRAMLALLLSTPALAQTPGAPLPPLPPIRLGRGVAQLSPGAWRVAFPVEAEAPDAEQRAALGRLGAALQAGTLGRVTLNAEASAGDDISTHRRLSLARARAVKAALVAGGLNETRVDIRALGRTEHARDVVDVLSPTAPR